MVFLIKYKKDFAKEINISQRNCERFVKDI